MGDTQSAQRDTKSEAAEEQGAVEDAPSEDNTQDKLIKSYGQISELNGKPDGTKAEVNGHCEDQIAEKAVISQDKVTSETDKAPEEVGNVEMIKKELPDANEEEPIEIINMDAKQNDINESFRKFFSNIGLKLTVKRGSADKTEDDAEKEDANKLEAVEETASETKYEDVEQNTDLNVIQDNDSTTCPTLTDVTSEDVPETAEEKTTETKEEVSDNIEDKEANVTMDEDADQNKDLEESSSNPEEEIVSPIKRFFTTGIFSSLRKKKKEEEEADKELLDMSKKDNAAATGEQEETVETSPNVEAGQDECKDVPAEPAQAKESVEVTDNGLEGKLPSTDQTDESEPEITSSQEKDKIQASPLKRLLSGSSFKRRSKRPKGRRLSDGKLSDSGEHTGDQLVASTESAEQQVKVEESPAPPAAEPEEEMSAWATFKKLLTPKRNLKRPSLSNEETQVPAAVEEPKPREGEQQISDHSTEEGRKRKDSSHSWEAVLCGSGRRRSRKTSDSEDETQQKQEGTEGDIVTSAPKQAESPSDSESGSTWRSFKKLVTPKRKAKDDEESKDNAQSDSEATQDESVFSIKKLLPGRKKRKSEEKPDQLSSDEAEKEAASMEEDSETPAVVPLSEFDKSETEAVTQTDDESQLSDDKHQEETDQEEVLEISQTFVQEVQEHQITLETKTPVIPALHQEPDELTEFSKYQQLSDIPEEGVITETGATPASVAEEAAKDDTIAEDMVEITSEAITAPELVDITMADETDELMLSAVSQLSDSSKTSGNATPVPAEYDVKETDVLLQQVVETISTSPEAIPVHSEDLDSERITGSVTPQTPETCVKEEKEKESDASGMDTGLHVDKLDEVGELVEAAVSECSEFRDAISTDIVSEVSREEFHSVEIDADMLITEAEEILTEERKDILPDEVSPLESHQVEAEITRTDCNEGESLLEKKDEAINQLLTEQKEINEDEQLTSSEIELLKEGVDTAVEKDIEEAKQEVEEINEQLLTSAKIDQEAAAEETPVQTPEGATELEKEVAEDQSIKPASDQHQEAPETLTDARVEAKAEDDVKIDTNIEDTQEPSLESQESPEEEVQTAAVLEEESVTDSAKQEQPTVDIATDEPGRESTGDNDQDSKDGQVPAVNDEANKEAEVEVKEQAIPDQAVTADESKHEGRVELEEQPILEAPTQEPEEKNTATENEVGAVTPKGEESVDDHQKEIIPEDIPDAQTGQIIESTADECESEAISQLDQALDINEDQTGALPVEVQVEQVDQSHEVTDNIETLAAVHVSSVHEEPSTALELENAVDLEETAETRLVTIEEPKHVVHVSEVEDNIEGEKEEQLACAETMVVEVEHAALPQETTCTPQNVTASIPDLVLQKTAVDNEKISEETSIPCVDSAQILEEPKHKAHLNEVTQVDLQGEKEEDILAPQTRTVIVQHAVVAQITTSSFQDVASGIPDVFIETTSEMHEPTLGTVTSEQEVKETVEMTTPLVVDNTTETAQEGNSVVVMHAPSVQLKDNHHIQVQVVEVDIQSAETCVDTMMEVGVQEDKEVIHICHETLEKVDSHSAISNIEQEIVTEEDKVAIREVIQHVKEIEPEKLKPVAEPEDTEEPSDLVDSKSSEEDQKSIETPDKELAIPSCDSMITTKDQVLTKMDEEIKEAQKQHSVQNQVSTPSNTAVAVPQNTGIISSIGNVESPSSLSLEFKLNIQFGQTRTPTSPSSPPPAPPERATPPSTPAAPPERATPPSTPAAPPERATPPSTPAAPPERATPPSPPEAFPVERTEPIKPTEMSEVGVQAVEETQPSKPINYPQRSETETKSSEAAVQTTEPPVQTDSIDRAVIKNQAVLMDVGIQSAETEEPSEQIKSTDPVESQNQPVFMDVGIQSAETEEPVEQKTSVETAVTQNQPILMDIQSVEKVEPVSEVKSTEVVIPDESIQPVKQSENREVFLCHAVVSEEPEQIKEPEDDCDQDVWMDAEENIDAPEKTAMPLSDIEESFESQPDYFQEPKEFEMAPGEETNQDINKTGLKCDIESEGEDFTVALEDPQLTPAAVSTTEWD